MKEIVIQQKEFFNTHITKSLEFRIENLKKLKKLIQEYESEIIDALYSDLRKSKFEAYETEIGVVIQEINYTIKHLKKWSKNRKVKTNLMNFKAKSYIKKSPYGSALIIAPWNYPFQLALSPLIGAIAAGNCAVLKPSEISKNTALVLEKMINNNFEKKYITVINGGIEVSEALLALQFDYIFFTGSVAVGKIIMEKASKHLIPVTLELGGKSPLIVDKKVNIDKAAKRIVWGKFLNAGQTCVAPDYLIVHKDIKDDLINAIKLTIQSFYGDNIILSPDYPRIINEKHFDRLSSLLEKQSVIYGCISNREERYISPTLIDSPKMDSNIMQEEIFGPILPVFDFETEEDIYNITSKFPNPLALYLFTNNKKMVENIHQNILFGGGCVNDTVMHLTSPYLPFGGVGTSGVGNYHGKASFDTFSHEKSILHKRFWFDLTFKYPPYNNRVGWLKKIMNKL
ncbi:aldehyde dehydrogenase [Mycoplasmatota bacterium]|nr:aldehyde dehydrogenase [Mycoplasmatota bacterium]